MTYDARDPLLMGLFAHSSTGPDDDGFADTVSTRIHRYRLGRGLISGAAALICGVLVAAILAPLIARMTAGGDLVMAIALFSCSLAGLGITLIRAEG
jgi:hypothetical protein